MGYRFSLAPVWRAGLLAGLAMGYLPAQPPADLIARLDRFAKTFNGAKAGIATVNHVEGAPEDEIEAGTILIKRTGGKSQMRIDFTGRNAYSVGIRAQIAEIYHPQLKQIDEWDLRAYKDVAQKYFLLGFGMPGTELAASYTIRGVKHDTVEGQGATYMELIPKSADVLKLVRSVEVWISDKTECPVRQIFHFPDKGWRSATFSAVEVNPKLSSDAFDLPKNAKRVRVN